MRVRTVDGSQQTLRSHTRRYRSQRMQATNLRPHSRPMQAKWSSLGVARLDALPTLSKSMLRILSAVCYPETSRCLIDRV